MNPVRPLALRASTLWRSSRSAATCTRIRHRHPRRHGCAPLAARTAPTTALGALPGFDDIAIVVLHASDAADPPDRSRYLTRACSTRSAPAATAVGAPGRRLRRRHHVADTTHTRTHLRDLRGRVPASCQPREKSVMAQQHGPSGSSGAYFGDSGGPTVWVTLPAAASPR